MSNRYVASDGDLSNYESESEITIFALIVENHINDQIEGEAFLLLDGIEQSSFNLAPENLALAAERDWEPETWMILIERKHTGLWPELTATEVSWVEVRFSINGSGEGNASLPASTVDDQNIRNTVTVSSVRRITAEPILEKLQNFSRLQGLPVATEQDIADVLFSAIGALEDRIFLVFDVGQANWNAVADASGCPDIPPSPALFFDCGVPMGRHYNSLPKTPINPFATASESAPVILSHWDMDHWAGAALGQPLFGKKGIAINWRPEAISDRKWIAPNQGLNSTGQQVSSTAWRLALALHRRGNLLLWPSMLKSVTSPNGDCIVKCVPAHGVPKNNNNSGLALIIKTTLCDGSSAFVLAPADAEYSSIGLSSTGAIGTGLHFTGLVASHHGGSPCSAPPLALPRWSKIAFSHGNKYGHPTTSSMTAHSHSGWIYVYETHKRKSRTLANGVQQDGIGTVCLGGSYRTFFAAVGNCQICRNSVETCPIQ